MTANGVDMKENTISYKGIRTNNLQDISVDLTKGKFYGIAAPVDQARVHWPMGLCMLLPSMSGKR